MSQQLKIQSHERTSRRNPCRVCQKDHWCLNLDTMTACTETESSYWNEGFSAWLHPLPGQSWDTNAPREVVKRERPPRPEPVARAPLFKRDRVYRQLLDGLILLPAHLEHLTGPKRQMTPEQVKARGYASLWGNCKSWDESEQEARDVAEALAQEFGDIRDIPGFGLRAPKRQNGEVLMGAFCPEPRILIPIRAIGGEIQGFQMHDPTAEKNWRYTWFSGVGETGASVGKPIHVSRPTGETKKPDAIITEGPLKADITSDQTGITTLAFQGVKCIDWDELGDLLDYIKPARVLLALDADRHRNPDVREAHEQLCRFCLDREQAFMVADWKEEDGKGIDDLLLNGKRPNWLEPEPPEPPPEEREREEIERYALTSSWSQPGTARELTKFPSAAWECKIHRACVEAIRRLLAAGEDLNTRSIRRMIKIHEPHLLPQWRDLENWYLNHQTGLAEVQKTALHEFREEWDWGSMSEFLSSCRERIRATEYGAYYQQVYKGLLALAPGSEETYEVESLESIMLRRIGQHTSPEGPPEIIIPTGITQLDAVLDGGFKQGWKVLLLGKPGSGKTTFAKQIAVNAGMNGFESLFMSLEMRKRSLGDRAIAMATQKPLRARYSKQDWETARQHAVHMRNVFVDDRPAKLDEFRQRVDNYLYKNPKTAAIYTDYAGRIKDRKRGQNTSEAASDVADVWADIADVHDICHVMLQQPTKEYDHVGKPDTGFIRDSGVYQQHADLILWFHRPCQFRDQIQRKDFAEIHVLKFREGKTPVVPVKVRSECFSVSDWVGELPTLGKTKSKKSKSKSTAEPISEEQGDLIGGLI